MSNGYTPTQQRMLNLLGDGLSHTKEELHGCLDDDLAQVECIRAHISDLRKRLRPLGQDIVNRYEDGAYVYRWVRIVSIGE